MLAIVYKLAAIVIIVGRTLPNRRQQSTRFARQFQGIFVQTLGFLDNRWTVDFASHLTECVGKDLDMPKENEIARAGIAVAIIFGLIPLFCVSCAVWRGNVAATYAARVQHDIVYAEPDGEKLTMDIYFPTNALGLQCPAVIYVHGGGWKMGSKAMIDIVPGPDELLRHNFIVASIDYRLAPEHKFPAMIEDAKCAVRFLRAHAKEFNIDPNHIGVMGDSAGGHIAVFLGLTGASHEFDGPCTWSNESSRVQAVVDLYGPTDFTDEQTNFNRQAIPLLKEAFGATGPNDPVLERASPIFYVSSNEPPFLILHGDHDGLVKLSESEELNQKLKAAGDSSRLIVITNFSHGFTPLWLTSHPTHDQLCKMIAEFFDAHLRH